MSGYSREMSQTYEQVFAANLRAARARSGISQATLARRMKRLGFGSWSSGKASECERGTRAVVMGELLALAVALETTLTELTGATLSAGEVVFPSGHAIGAVSVRNSALGMQDHAVTWDDDLPSITRPGNTYSARAWDQTLLTA